MREPTRIDPIFVEEQKVRREVLKDEPGQAGGLPALKDRVEHLEEILALRIPNT